MHLNHSQKIILLLCLFFILALFVRSIRLFFRKRKLRKRFGIADLSAFKVQLSKGKANNAYVLKLPHWWAQDENGNPKRKFLNKVIWEKSTLYLQSYELTTKYPWDMIFLVHTLRSNGHSVEPCEFELDKQKDVDNQYSNIDAFLASLPDAESFAALCKQRLQLREFRVLDAPGDNLFIQKNGKSQLVKCLFIPRSHLINSEEMMAIREAFDVSLAENCVLITTGKLSVSAARYAMDNHITAITDARLVSLLTEENEILPGKEYLRWELTNKDLVELLPPGILTKKGGKQLKC